MNASDVMTRNILSVRPDTSVAEAIRLMPSTARSSQRRERQPALRPARSATPSMAFPMPAARFRGSLASRPIILPSSCATWPRVSGRVP